MRLRELRLNRGLTQMEVAMGTGIHPSELSRLEKGTRNPRAETLARLAEFFDVSVDYLLGRTDQPNGKEER